MADRFSNPAPQHFDSPNVPMAGGKLTFFQVGSTTILKDTFSDNGLAVANANPVILSASGLEPNIFLNGSYRVTLQNSEGVQRWDRDNVNVGATGEPFSLWVSTIQYGSGGSNIVTASNGLYYVSIQDPNIANDPTTSPAFWSEVRFTRIFNTNESYTVNRIVEASDGNLYTAQVAQSGNDPTTDSINWRPTNLPQMQAASLSF